MGAYAARHAASFGRALVMPNTLPPVSSAAEIGSYRREIGAATAGVGRSGASFEALMSFKLLAGMSRATVLACAEAGAVAAKYYPAGATTNSADGIADPASVEEALTAMEDCDLVLSIHGEESAAPVMEREAAFLPRVEGILARHPRLRVVLEHISTRESLSFLDWAERAPGRSGRLAATITAHHLLFSIDDLMGSALDPHLYCKPVLKTRADRDALRDAVFSGRPRIFFGSDSAPHPRSAKEGRRAAAGIYSSPSALPALAALFEEAGRLGAGALTPFVAAEGAAFYGLPPPRGSLELVRKEWTVPEELDGVVPMLAGATLPWRLAGATR